MKMSGDCEWSVHLWDRQSEVDQRTVRSIDSVDRLVKFIKERAAIELEYSKQTLKLIDKFSIKKKAAVPDNGPHALYSMDAAYQKVLDNARAVSLQHQELSECLHRDIYLQTKPKEYRQRQHHIDTQCRNRHKAVAQLHTKLTSIEKDFKKTCLNCEDLRNRYEQKNADDNVTKADVQKAHGVFEKKKQEVERRKQEYATALQNFNREQYNMYNEDFPTFLQTYQKLDRELNEVLITTLNKYVEMEREKIRLGSVIQSCLDGSKQHINEASIDTDQATFTERNKSGYPRPQHEKDLKFKDYSEGIGTSAEAITARANNSLKHNNDPFTDRYPNSRYAHLPPAQRRRKISEDLQDTRDQIDRKKNEIKGVKTLLDQYVKNPKLGDPQTVAPQYEMARTELEKIHEREQVLGSMLREATAMLDEIQLGGSATNDGQGMEYSMPHGASAATSFHTPDWRQDNNSSHNSGSSPTAYKSTRNSAHISPSSAHSSNTAVNDRWKQPAQTAAVVAPPPPPPYDRRPSVATRVAAFDFTGDPEDGSITIYENDELEVVTEDCEGWTEVKRLASGTQGYVPTSYLE